MLLLRARLVGLLPFDDVTLPFCDDEGRPRSFTVIHGGAGVGKTTVLGAIASTRPGFAVVPPGRPLVRGGAGSEEPTPTPHAICDWATSQDDPARPHTLCITTPTVRLWNDDEEEAFRRREQALYDKRARERGYVFVALPSTRWFSRQPIGINAPAQTLARYDVRSPISFDDASRSDLARETKQALAYAEITGALSHASSGKTDDGEQQGALLGIAMREAVNRLTALAGFTYRGLDTPSLEPVFADSSSRRFLFDALPNRVRHLIAFAALPVRALWAAYPQRDPREGEAVVVIDEVDLHQDPVIHPGLVSALRASLPQVQWIVTTSASAVAGSCDTKDVLALRRLPELDRIELFVGSEARTH
jgi:hypothetical protein